MIIARLRVGVSELDDRRKPVPVQQGDVAVRSGRRVPAQEMVVVQTELAGPVVVADVVKIGLRQRYVDHAEDQEADSQRSCPTPIKPPPQCHDSAPIALVKEPGTAGRRRAR
jgi:hypothetical protein